MNVPVTVGAWLAGRMPPPPDLLNARINAALGINVERSVADTELVCLDAAERVLARLFHGGFAGRTDALDLLAADALVTYALEFAASAPREFESRASSAIVRFSELGSVST